jgi:peptide/nickel transport system ATP-binding protein
MSKPALLILDEPTTALDVTVEAAVVDLVKDLGKKYGTSMLFISHNLGLVLETCDRLCVMYAGEAVETGPIPEMFEAMRHPYTQGLLRAIPRPGADRATRPLVPIPGSLPSPQALPPGCSFGPRCSHFIAGRCDAGEIPMVPVTPTHATRCIRWAEIDWTAPPPVEATAPPPPPGAAVLRVDDLEKRYAVAPSALFGGDARVVRANASVSFAVREAETLAIVGESGCGKSTLARLLLGLDTASGGTVHLDGVEIGRLPVEARDPRIVAAIQMVFQNPFDTLNPSMRVGAQIVRVLEKFGVGRTPAEREARMLALLDRVKLPRAFAGRMPRQLSGGQKQRIGIARAFAGTPAVVVADEPVSALDVSVQAAVTELLTGIQRECRTTMLLISHDLGLVRYLAERVMVMYLGHVVEIGTTAQVFAPPYHPYTEALLSAMPIADPRVEKARIVLEGEIPSALDPPSGCPFQTRCPRKHQVPGKLCETVFPPFVELAPGHRALCHLPAEVFARMRPVIRDTDHAASRSAGAP